MTITIVMTFELNFYVLLKFERVIKNVSQSKTFIKLSN
jgi:hypothetical protein